MCIYAYIMKLLRTWVNEAEYKELREQCISLGITEYEFVKRAVFERMARNGNSSVIAKIQKWLVTDHPILPRNTKPR